jgi:CheY-like chemotaxis protein
MAAQVSFHFTVRLKLPSAAVAKKTPLLPPELEDLRVLVVDDNATNRGILKDMLTHWHMRPVLVDGGAAALVALEHARDAKQPFGLMLLDVRMPVMDGLAVMQHVRLQPAMAPPTILMLNGDSRVGDVNRCRELGAGAVLIKPIKPSELLDAVVEALSISYEWKDRQPAIPPSPAVRRGRGLRILVAEDNAINRLVVVLLLEMAKCSVVVAVNGKEALATLEREAFDLVLMDVQMPIVDGLEATALIRAKEKATGRHLPIVAMTAHAMKGDRERCLEAGMDAYVPKPIEQKDLFSAMWAVLGATDEAASRTEESEEVATRTTVPDPVGDNPPENDSLRHDEAFRRVLAEMFLEDCPKFLSEIREAVSQRNGPALNRAAHRLKGSTGVFKDQAAVEAAQRIEIIGRDADWDHAETASVVLTQELDRLMATLNDLVGAGVA